MKSTQLEGHGILGYQSELTVEECIILKGLFEELNAIVQKPASELTNENMESIRNAAVVIGKISGGVLSMNQTKNNLFDIKPVDGVELVDNMRREEYSR